MFQAVGNHTQSKGLDLRLGFFLSPSIGENPGEIDYFRNPAPIFLLFNFNREGHGSLYSLT